MAKLLFSFLTFVLVFLTAALSNAFIPTSKTILSRATHQHGKGAYVVEQDVTLKTDGEPIVLREKWTVVNAETMRLSVSRKGADGAQSDVKFEMLYRSGKRTITDSAGAAKTSANSSEFIEPYFYFRTPGSLQAALIRAKVLPSDFGQKQRQIVPANPKDKSENALLVSVAEPYVRLSRTAGVIDYGLGRISENEAGSPGAWVDQDSFTLRRIKFPSLAEVEADQYLSYANQLKFPRERIIKWGTYSATTRVVSIRTATDQEAAKNLSLTSNGNDATSRVPENAGLKEFYTRFR